ncbi:MAG: putative DNA binding domain-containing protein [Bacteroidetes bacterium]|nr:putative DNA binding domain-containing protein [Bacteroidota bacterium]
MKENSHFDRKSLRIITGKTADWKELAKDCVCFANGVGGEIHIGIEDGESEPDPTQKIPRELIEELNKKIPNLTLNVGVAPVIEVAENGGEYINLVIHRSKHTIAGTTDGRYYMRVSDDCKPVMPDELTRLVSEKDSFVWEEKVVRKVAFSEKDEEKFKTFIADIRSSERVSDFVKQKSPEEIAEHYFLIHENCLTNLGVLWIGNRKHRTTLHYAPSVQFIKYDEHEKKVFKKIWDDYTLNPKELISEVITTIPDWNEYVEVSDGMFRKNIYHYPPEVIREIVANALAHRNYTMRGDIFINLYTDRLEIHSPGLLPLGVTPDNILIRSVQRNQLLAKLFYDVKLMEKEGSGYDRVYEIMLENGKEIPEVIEGDDRVVVTLKKKIIDVEVLKLIEKASGEYSLWQRELICLGLIAQKGGLQATDLVKILGVHGPNALNNWLGRLTEYEILLTRGRTKGTFYYVNPRFLKQANFVEQTNLKRIEPHRLKELIYEDLRNYPESKKNEIHKRIGIDIKERTLKAKLDEMLKEGIINKSGERRWTKYSIALDE